MLMFLVFLLLKGVVLSLPFSSKPILLVVDSFEPFIKQEISKYCEEHEIQLNNVLSSYAARIMESKGYPTIPPKFIIPNKKSEILDWVYNHHITPSNNEFIQCILCESDSGVTAAESLECCLKVNGNGNSNHMRDKFEANEICKRNGLQTVQQCKISNKENIKELFSKMFSNGKCIVKPCRGVGSEDVFLAYTYDEAIQAFDKIKDSPKYGGGVNDEVLFQEYITGTEYAVDTVSCNGEIKVVAMWKYHKLPLNGGPFVYQCTELVGSEDEHAVAAAEYSIAALNAVKHRWGATHTEVIVTRDGPRLVEINTRWHAAPFADICLASFGYSAIDACLDAFFDQASFNGIPSMAFNPAGRGRIIHLINCKEGTVEEINRHIIKEIQSLPSFLDMDLYYEKDSEVVRTTNIKTDSGYVCLHHTNLNQIQKDYDLITKQLQHELFRIKVVERGEEEEKNEK